jgi:hypothetical protein
MRLQICGASKNHQKHCRQFARLFSSKFFSKELSKQITIKLKFEKRKKIRYNDLCAEVEWMDNPRQPRKFNVTIFVESKPNLLYVVSSLAHELVHVKQYVKNELVDLVSTDFNVAIFKNKKYNLNKISYFDQPWEIEAFGRTPGLTREYFERVKIAGKILKQPVDF